MVGVDSGIVTFEDMKGKRVAAAVGTVPEQEFLKYAERWDTVDLYQGYQSENEVFLAVAQGKADAGITTNTAVKPITEQYETVIAGPRMPWTTDYTSVVAPRKDFGWINYLNLFITHQVRSGRYQELWGQFVGGEAPQLRIPRGDVLSEPNSFGHNRRNAAPPVGRSGVRGRGERSHGRPARGVQRTIFTPDPSHTVTATPSECRKATACGCRNLEAPGAEWIRADTAGCNPIR